RGADVNSTQHRFHFHSLSLWERVKVKGLATLNLRSGSFLYFPNRSFVKKRETTISFTSTKPSPRSSPNGRGSQTTNTAAPLIASCFKAISALVRVFQCKTYNSPSAGVGFSTSRYCNGRSSIGAGERRTQAFIC